eukprot:GEZU01043588.1.p1 GENE.GEZU01043588.1~~GEZU01043588.1.p1  ORF type:complete len:130 (+),score=45.92 GEZU01043588.1:48-437(+)
MLSNATATTTARNKPLFPVSMELAKKIEEESKKHNGEYDDLAKKCMTVAKALQDEMRTVNISAQELSALESGIDNHDLTKFGISREQCKNLKIKLQQAHDSNSRRPTTPPMRQTLRELVARRTQHMKEA